MSQFVQPTRPVHKPLPKGISCPGCGCCETRVIRTRSDRPGRIRRTRQCKACGKRTETFEFVVGRKTA